MLLFYCHTLTPRLKYILDFFSNYLFDNPIRITTDTDEFASSDLPKLNYSPEEILENEFYLCNNSLLFENGINKIKIDCFDLNFHKAFFETRGDFPFDIFAASFYLLSRYEEYLPHEKDSYDRYAHTNSLAFREGFLHLPLINIWFEVFKHALRRKFPEMLFRHQHFTCIITYDIDMAYSYLHKGWLRTAGGFAKAILHGEWELVGNRWLVLQGKKTDPFDCYEWLDALHLYCRIKPYFFFLVAKRLSKYDRNTRTTVKAFRDLIEYYARSSKIGIHPSWQTGNNKRLLKEEIQWLGTITDQKINYSRQHYIRFALPQTYRDLIDAGIEKDFSMGYGSINGFRASISSPFYWYDLEKEESTGLLIYPFCFMDANSFFEQKQSPQQTYKELIHYYEQVKKTNSTLITIWHNYLLGTDTQFEGWRDMFEVFMKETVYWDAYYDQT